MTKLQAAYDDAQAEMLTQMMASTATSFQACAIKAQKTEDGSVYYYNETTQETSWEKPDEYAALEANVKLMAASAAEQVEDNIAAAPEDVVATVVSAMEAHADNDDLSQSMANTLEVLSANAANCDAIARVGGIRAIMAALRANPGNVQLLRVLCLLLERISRNDFYKEEIAREGGIEIVVDIGLMRHTAEEDLCSKCLSILANMAFNSTPNIDRTMAAGGVDGCEKAMQAYPNNPRLLENAMCTLSNLMFGSDDNKLTIGQTCGDEIVDIIRKHHADANLFKMALRALGNLSYCDENIRFIVDNGAAEEIVHGMQAHSADEECLQLAMEVLGNFASLEEPDGSATEPVSHVIYRQGGTGAIIGAMKALDFNSAILKSGMDALSNIANDVETTELMAKHQGIVELIIGIMQAHDWDEELIEHSVPLLSTLTYAPECTELILTQGGIQTLLAVMDTHGANTDLISNAQLALSNLAVSPEGRVIIRNIDGAVTVLRQIEAHMSQKPFVQVRRAVVVCWCVCVFVCCCVCVLLCLCSCGLTRLCVPNLLLSPQHPRSRFRPSPACAATTSCPAKSRKTACTF